MNTYTEQLSHAYDSAYDKDYENHNINNTNNSTEYILSTQNPIPMSHSSNHQPLIRLGVNATSPFIPRMKAEIKENDIIKSFTEMQEERNLSRVIHDERIMLNTLLPTSLEYGLQKHEVMPYTPNFFMAHSDCNFSSDGVDMAALGCISIPIGRLQVHLNETWKEAPSLHIIQMSESATKKTSLVYELSKPIYECEEKFDQIIKTDSYSKAAVKQVLGVVNNFSSSECKKVLALNGINNDSINTILELAEENNSLLKQIKTLADDIDARLLITEATPYGLRRRLKKQGEFGGCITAEGDMVKLILKYDDPTFFNKAHDQENYSRESGREKTNFKNPSFSTVNLVQSLVAVKVFSNNDLDELGTSPRFMPFFHSSVSHDIPYNEELRKNLLKKYQDKIKRLYELYCSENRNKGLIKVYVEDDAYILIKEFENEIKNSYIPNMNKITHKSLRKLHGKAVRFALAIHAYYNEIPHDSKINKEEMAMGINLCKRTIPHIRYAYSEDELRAFENAHKILANFRNINCNHGNLELQQGFMYSRTIQQRTHIKAREIINALRLLEKHGWVKCVDIGNRSNIVIIHQYALPNKYTLY